MRKFMLLGILTILFPFALSAQNIKVSGKVLDASTNEALVGVTVVQTGTQNGTITDLDGNFTLDNVASDASLSFSYIGYVTETIFVNGKSTIVCNLKTDDKELEEIVVVGYGVQRKSDLTGSVASVGADDIKNLSVTDAASALQGKAAGIQVLSYSGAPGEKAAIRVRGYSSNSGEIGPLLIVDGMKVDNIQYLDPSMIQSMEVLKDGASAAIYGAEAGNGVILITTKSGSEGKSSITYSYKLTSTTLGKMPELMDRDQYIDFMKMKGQPIEDQMRINADKGTNTDWIDLMFENGLAQQHNITFQGGNNKGHYLLSVNYLNNDGIVIGKRDVYERLSTQMNADYKVKDWLTISNNLNIEKWSTKSVSQMSETNSVMMGIYQLDPLTEPYRDVTGLSEADLALAPVDDEGNYLGYSKYSDNDQGSPLIQLYRSKKSNGGFNVRGITSANFSPIKCLVITSRLAYRISQNSSHEYSEPWYATSMAKNDNYNISGNVNTEHQYQFENFANFNKTFGKHSVGAMVGYTFQAKYWDNLNASATSPSSTPVLKAQFDNFQYLDYVAGSSDVSKSFGNAPGKATNIGIVSRLTYSYDNKYSVQANFRADAYDSSKLDKSKRWGKFPSFSLGWTVSEESFIKDNISTDVLSFFKIRGGYGINGNINILKDYKYNSTISVGSQWYQYAIQQNAEAFYGSRPSGLVNYDLTWETSNQLDLGFDLKFLKSRLTLSFDYYKKVTKDQLADIPPLPEIGVLSTTLNVGEIENSGVEIDLGWRDKVNELNYSVKANLAYNKNEVTYLAPFTPRILKCDDFYVNKFRTAFEKGHPIWYFRAYRFDGLDENGNAKIKDLNDDGFINEGDMEDVGQGMPKLNIGLTINLEYKGFDLTVFGTGAFGHSIFPALYRTDRPYNNTLEYFHKNSWSETNKNAKFPNPASETNLDQFWASDAVVFKGDYFKFKQIQLGYTIPASITNKVKISNLRVYVSLDDYFTISDYPGFDPETATTNIAEKMGVDMGTYPSTKKLMFGVNVTF